MGWRGMRRRLQVSRAGLLIFHVPTFSASEERNHVPRESSSRPATRPHPCTLCHRRECLLHPHCSLLNTLLLVSSPLRVTAESIPHDPDVVWVCLSLSVMKFLVSHLTLPRELPKWCQIGYTEIFRRKTWISALGFRSHHQDQDQNITRVVSG